MKPRKSKAPAVERAAPNPIEIIDNVDRALKLSTSTRLALALLGGDSGFGPVLMAAMERQTAELTEAREGLRGLFQT